MAEESTSPYNITLPKDGVYWARMAGYAPWPVRYCSAPEADRILPLKSNKNSQVPVFFLSTLDVAWVGRNSVEPFTAATVAKKLDRQKFKVHKPYRFAVVEAMRVASARGEMFSEDVQSLVDTYEECTESLAREDVCSECHGSEMSGDALLCDNCNVSETHLHCLRPQISEAPEGNWFCTYCAKSLGVPPGFTHPPKTPKLVEGPSPQSRKSKSAPSLGSSDAALSEDKATTQHRKRRSSAELLRVNNASDKINGGRGASSNRTGGTSILENLQKLVAATSADVESAGRNNECPTNKNEITDDVGEPHHTSVLGKTDGVYNSTVRTCSGYRFPDTCCVCELGGKMQLCDYPGCRRAYHQTCVPKKFPVSVSVSFGDNACEDFEDPIQSEPWICPSHFCVRCRALSCGNGMQELSIRSLPSYLKINGDHILRKPLSSCGKCPMSICLDCEADLGAGVPVILLGERLSTDVVCGAVKCGAVPIDVTKLSDNYDPSADVFAVFPDGQQSPPFSSLKSFAPDNVGLAAVVTLQSRVQLPTMIYGISGQISHAEEEGFLSLGGRAARRRGIINYRDNMPRKMLGQKTNIDLLPICLNCSSLDNHLSLAKSLERMISTVFNSRLCLPFYRPLLPLGSDSASDRNALKLSGGKNLSLSQKTPNDLLGILEKIRRLGYQSAAQVIHDLEDLRNKAKVRVQEVNEESKQIEWAIDYLVETAERFDNMNQTTHRRLEKSISEIICISKTVDTSIISHDIILPGKRSREDSASWVEDKRLKLNDAFTNPDEYSKVMSSISNSDRATRNIAVAQNEMKSIWRRECETPIKYVMLADRYTVPPKRLMADWVEYLLVGQMPSDAKRSPAEYQWERNNDASTMVFAEPNIVDVQGDLDSNEFPVFENGKISWMRSMGIEDLASEVEAAQIMHGLRYSNKRENISLQHSQDTSTGPNAPEEDPMILDPLGTLHSINASNDDNFIILNQLKETSRRTMMLSAQLHQRLRKQHHDDLHNSSNNITIGEGTLVSELKVANDNLRWRLQQKSRTITALREREADLQSVVDKLSATIKEKDQILMQYQASGLIRGCAVSNGTPSKANRVSTRKSSSTFAGGGAQDSLASMSV